MVQFKYNVELKRYLIIVSDVQEFPIGHISETDDITLYRELSTRLVRNILLHWDEYGFQLAREMEEVLNTKPEDKGE